MLNFCLHNRHVVVAYVCTLVQAAGKFDVEVVQRQLRYTGMLATVQIRQAGYNYRLTFEVIVCISLLRCFDTDRRMAGMSFDPVNYTCGQESYQLIYPHFVGSPVNMNWPMQLSSVVFYSSRICFLLLPWNVCACRVVMVNVCAVNKGFLAITIKITILWFHFQK